METDVATEEKSSIFKDALRLFQEADFAEAIRLLNEHLADSKDDLDALHLLGTSYARSGDYLSAERTFKKALELDQEQADTYFNLGLIHSRQNRFSEATGDFEKAIELNPDDIQALNDLGVIYFNLGKKDEAGEFFARALAVNPSFKEAFLNLFELLWNEDQYSSALERAFDYLKDLPAGPSKIKLAKPPEPANQPEIKPSAAIMKAGGTEAGEMKAPAYIPSENIRKSGSAAIEMFEKHVPEKLKGRKTGLNIAVVADYNIAGQLTGLFRLINENTIHRARCIIVQDDYLSYDKDIVLSSDNGDDWEQARQIIENADFFHIGRFPRQYDRFPLLKYIKPENTIVQYFGSELRQNARPIYNWHRQNNITGVAAWDYTMIENSPFFYHINMMFDSSRVQPAPRPEGTIRIVHPTTNRHIKKTELFLDAMEKLQGKYNVEPVIIEGKTNEECLAIKARSHMTYDQISVGIYGVSAIESMAAGHVVFGGISNFAASVQPDNPIVWVTPDNLAERIKYYLVNRVQIIERGLAGKAWVKQHHDPMKILRQHLYLYDLVQHGHRFMPFQDEQMLG